MPRDSARQISRGVHKYFYVVRFVFGKYAHQQSIFAIIADNEGDLSFVHVGNRLIFFTHIEDKGKVLEAANFPNPDYSFKDNGIFTVDCAEAIRLAAYSTVDTKSIILNFINTIDDALRTIHLPVPENYCRAVYHLADHLTFDENFEQILQNGKVTRKELITGFKWMVQALISNMVLMKPNTQQ